VLYGHHTDCYIAAGPRQHGNSWFRVPRDSCPYFSVSESSDHPPPDTLHRSCPLSITSGRTPERTPPPTVPLSSAYFPCASVCLYLYPPIVVRQWLGKNRYRCNKYTRNNRRIIGHAVFYAVRVVSKVKRRLVLPRIYFSCRLFNDALTS
jgi:hypothetical protein